MMSSGCDGTFQLNRVIPIDEEALVQWVEMDVNTFQRFPWQHTTLCSIEAAAEVEMMGACTYQQVLNRAAAIQVREIRVGDIDALVSAPTRYYPALQGQGGWW